MFCVDQTFDWYEDACNVRKRYLNVSDFHHCYGIFFASAILKVPFIFLVKQVKRNMRHDFVDKRQLKTVMPGV